MKRGHGLLGEQEGRLLHHRFGATQPQKHRTAVLVRYPLVAVRTLVQSDLKVLKDVEQQGPDTNDIGVFGNGTDMQNNFRNCIRQPVSVVERNDGVVQSARGLGVMFIICCV